jgi:hypothetical protein
MRSTVLTVRLPVDLAEWLEKTARTTGIPKSKIVREQLEKARIPKEKPFMHLIGAISGPPDLSSRKGYSRK